MAFTVPNLAYGFEALEPHIDTQTMQIHHGKHHAAYVNNLNKATEGKKDFEAKSIEDLVAHINAVPENIRTAVRNNGGGHYNHSLFWETIGPKAGGQPPGELADAIKADLGGFDAFKEKFTAAATTRFGSGWAWLIVTNGKLAVCSTPNQDNPVSDGSQVILPLDVWEHAYYLKYQNRRPEYVGAWWNVVNWAAVGKRFNALR